MLNKAFALFFLSLLGISSYGFFCLKQPKPPKFLVQKFIFDDNKLPIFESYIIPQPKFLKAAHSSTFEVLPNHDLVAFWFAGSHEGKPDVHIWQSRFTNNKWLMAKSIVSPQSLAKDLGVYVKKIGNPVVYRALNGALHLFVVSVGIGGWSGSSLNHLISYDNGQTWGKARKLMLSPLLNISTLNRTRAVTLEDGGFYLPVYHELIYTYPELLRFDKNGNLVSQIRIANTHDMLQPALLIKTNLQAEVFLRNNTRHNQLLYSQTTQNGGLSWSERVATNLINHDSSLVVAEIESHEYLMLRNLDQRSRLILATSTDGIKWQDIADLENTPQMEFSYPSIQVHSTGIVDILYTWDRRAIKHVRFNSAWLKRQKAKYNANY